MNNKLVLDNSYTFHTKIYCNAFNFSKNVLIRARTGTCATTGTFTFLFLRLSPKGGRLISISPPVPTGSCV